MQYIKKQKPNKYVARCKTQHNIPDTMTKGFSIYLKEPSEETLTMEDNDSEESIAFRMGIEDGNDFEGL